MLKKAIPYILAALLLLVGGAIYLQVAKSDQPLLSAALNFGKGDGKSEEQPKPEEAEFKNYGPAPEFAGISKWLNTDKNAPLKMADLKGKVTLINFWTYSDINSVRTLPYVTKWEQTYKDQGLAIVGVHTPEFAFEKVTGNLENAIKTHDIHYPVAQDNDYKTWTAYHNQFWPSVYLIDRDGNIVYTHFGESNYDVTEKAIRTLLGLEGAYTTPPPAEQNQANSPEIFFGLAKLKNFGNTETANTEEQIFVLPKKLGDNKFALEGRWQFNQEAAVHTTGFGKIKLNFNAAKVFLVAESAQATTIRVYVDGELIKGVVVKDSNLYQLYDSISGGPHTMEIEVPDGGFKAFTFTFG